MSYDEIPFLGSSYACPYCHAPTLTPGTCPVCEREQVIKHETEHKKKLNRAVRQRTARAADCNFRGLNSPLKFHKPFGYAILTIGLIGLMVFFLYLKEPFTLIGFLTGVSSTFLWREFVEEGLWWSYK